VIRNCEEGKAKGGGPEGRGNLWEGALEGEGLNEEESL
jgi:hypothetical protein